MYWRDTDVHDGSLAIDLDGPPDESRHGYDADCQHHG